MKVFWCWQSDTEGKIGRFFIRDALEIAIEKLKLELELDLTEPSERESTTGLHLDHDRKGISGSPNLAQEILRKIDASKVFVAGVA